MKVPVVDLPAAAGGAALLEQGGPAVVEVCQAEDFGGSPDEGLGDIVTVPGDYPVPLALRRDPGVGRPPKSSAQTGDAGVLLQQLLQLRKLVALPVVPAAHPKRQALTRSS